VRGSYDCIASTTNDILRHIDSEAQYEKHHSDRFCSIFFTSTFAFALEQFSTEGAAQKHCQGDVVVWLNLPTGIFHFKGERWYGRTKSGAYVCKKAAEAEGDRATRNGQ
jgi:hypothetical protein